MRTQTCNTNPLVLGAFRLDENLSIHGIKRHKSCPRKLHLSVHNNEFNGKLASESIQTWMQDAGVLCSWGSHATGEVASCFVNCHKALRVWGFCC